MAPRLGTALLFYNVLPTGHTHSVPIADNTSYHLSCDVAAAAAAGAAPGGPAEGWTKWAANNWFRTRP